LGLFLLEIFDCSISVFMLLDVSQPELGLRKVIAEVTITVVHQSQRLAAGFGKDAQRCRATPTNRPNWSLLSFTA
jgi:hypothetical protein